MTLTSQEVNYLIWRYFQEVGLELSAYALDDETKIHELDELYKNKIPIGSLVNFIQKGILYTMKEGEVLESKSSLHEFAKELNLLSSIKHTNTEIVPPSTNTTDNNSCFTRVLKSLFTYPSSMHSSFNPSSEKVLAWGERKSKSVICVINDQSQIKIDVEHYVIENEKGNDITLVSWSRLGDSLLTCCENGEIRMWEADGKIKMVLHNHASPIVHVSWSPDSRSFLTLDSDNVVIIWDSFTGKARQVLDAGLKDRVLGLDTVWIDESKVVVPGLKNSIHIFQVSEKEPVGTLYGHSNTITSLAYYKELHLLASGSDDNDIRIWRSNSLNSAQLLQGHTQPILSLDWLPTNEKFKNPDLSKLVILISTSMDGSIRVWDVYKGDTVMFSLNENGVPFVCSKISPDKTKIVTGDLDGSIKIWSINYQSLEQFLSEHKLDASNTGTNIQSIECVAEYEPNTSKKEEPDENDILIDDDVDEKQQSGNDLEDDKQIFITSLSWNKNGSLLSVSYSNIDSVVIKVDQL
ncbi:Set3C histone deacetylase complex subunit [Komagataella phaffii CBS 7435]|uniref:WD40 repeat-containing subunit of the Set3C histone deacetylase complex n=2 Tax=Komagataella phaffii TaxID=460519 RepID=C4QXR1_KOMPG|nr:WD40 repeat-containing subunit of the Set3C histone deacetylase complex [Komagataella phaffii GS115]AOA60524.1 GQ67_01979T0 [Komagataella phaffii]CAH2446851.1 Set3C histone deacetylase complex subunit [Komagataella phaffii CBS 7435]AOA66548.1 GQ68_01994T0 [Komagataella phaffii GS115]CAY68034.1 WD40 repeat-containing subunit of the Set3C histone deacetylase complex [Komagataella phaffii GS115]CCA37110.1 Set3C histone deacetylase complex subunit [Komagataella phaffii CBS 7435]